MTVRELAILLEAWPHPADEVRLEGCDCYTVATGTLAHEAFDPARPFTVILSVSDHERE